MGRARSVLPILAALPLLMGSGGVAYERAERMLGRGNNRIAAKAFRKALEADPEHAAARVGLGRALAGVGRCEAALEQLEQVRGSASWSAEAAVAEGTCRRRISDLSQASAALEEALVLRPDDGPALFQLALLRFAEGDPCDECLEALATSPTGENRYWIAQVWAAWEEGDQAVTWDLLWELRAQQRLTPTAAAQVQAWLVEGLLWLDLDDPVQAERALGQGLELSANHLRSALWLGEALRRQGLVLDADYALDRRMLAEQSPAPLALALMARVRVDEGRLVEAEDLLSQHPDPHDPEYLASRWYLARALGEPTAPWTGARSPLLLIPIAEESP